MGMGLAILMGYAGVVLWHSCDKASVGTCGNLVGKCAEGMQMGLESFRMGTNHRDGVGTGAKRDVVEKILKAHGD